MGQAVSDGFETERLVIRRERIADAEALHEAYRDRELMRWWSSGPHANVAETVAYLTPRADGADWLDWAVTRRGDDRAIGTLAMAQRRPGVVEIGYLFVRSAWGNGYAGEGVAALIDRLFADGNRRVYADTDPDNAPSIALLERLGFTLEGRLRAEWHTHIGVRDSLIWGLLREEWLAGPAPDRSPDRSGAIAR